MRGGREGGKKEGGEGGRGGMTVIHIILMAPHIQTNNEELYLYNNNVTYYVITCKSAFYRPYSRRGHDEQKARLGWQIYRKFARQYVNRDVTSLLLNDPVT